MDKELGWFWWKQIVAAVKRQTQSSAYTVADHTIIAADDRIKELEQALRDVRQIVKDKQYADDYLNMSLCGEDANEAIALIDAVLK